MHAAKTAATFSSRRAELIFIRCRLLLRAAADEHDAAAAPGSGRLRLQLPPILRFRRALRLLDIDDYHAFDDIITRLPRAERRPASPAKHSTSAKLSLMPFSGEKRRWRRYCAKRARHDIGYIIIIAQSEAVGRDVTLSSYSPRSSAHYACREDICRYARFDEMGFSILKLPDTPRRCSLASPPGLAALPAAGGRHGGDILFRGHCAGARYLRLEPGHRPRRQGDKMSPAPAHLLASIVCSGLSF